MHLLRSRLAVRIYLAGLAQFAVVVLGFMLLSWGERARDRRSEQGAKAAASEVVAKLGKSDELGRVLDKIDHEDGAWITVYDAAGKAIATNRGEGAPPLGGPPPPHEGTPPLASPRTWLPWMSPPGPGDHVHHRFGPPGPDHGPPPGSGPGFGPPPEPMLHAFMVPVTFADGTTGGAVYAPRERRPPPSGFVVIGLVLSAIGIASLLTARSLVRPLRHLSRSAKRLGEGDLSARANLDRSDEIGEVASAFDEMAERMSQSIRAEKELLANVSHELRTPLARIRVALDLASEGDAETARVALTDITDDLGELEQLISDVLAAARLDLASGSNLSASPPLRKESLDLNSLLEQAATRFRAAHPTRALTMAIAPHLPTFLGDAVLLRRAVDNLLDNAHKYSTERASEVTLAARTEHREVVIEVRDRGIGIAESDLPNLFRPFFRADKSRTRATGGLGLGLALVKRIVDAHAGTITVESRLGEGTMAQIRLPIGP